MKRFQDFICLFANCIIRGLACIVVLFLLLQSLYSTSFIGRVTDEEGKSYFHTLNIPDRPLLHFFIALIVLVSLVLLICRLRKTSYIKSMQMHTHTIFKWFSIFLGISGLIWILITQLTPSSDPGKVYAIAMQWRQGNFSAFAEGGYLFRYPFQSGIVCFYYFLSFFFGRNNYLGIQLVNIGSLLLIYYLLSRLASCYWKTDRTLPIATYAALLLWCPLFFYITYLYGILPGMACSLSAVYLAFRYLSSRRYFHMILSALCMGMATVLKMNCLIYCIAILCFLLYDALTQFLTGRKSIRIWASSLLFVLVLITGVWGSNKLANRYVEHLSGYTLPEGAAMVSWVVMGLSEAELGPGGYTGYINHAFVKYHYDTGQITSASLEKLDEIWQQMRENPAENAFPFFARKTAFQWNDPTFLSLDRTRDQSSAVVLPAMIQSLIEGNGSTALSIALNFMHTLILSGVLLFLISRWRSQYLYELMGIVIFLGGFLFHFVWESSASYTIPYFVLLIPYGIKGYLDSSRWLSSQCAILAANKGRRLSALLRGQKRPLLGGTLFFLIFIGGLFVLQKSPLFYTTIALDDGADAIKQFYDSPQANELLPDGYYYLSPAGCPDSALVDLGGGLQMMPIDSGRTNEISIKKYRKRAPEKILITQNHLGAQLRFCSTENVLSIDTANETPLLSTYLNDELNLYYAEQPSMQYNWQLISAGDGFYYLTANGHALTFLDGYVLMMPFAETDAQKWLLHS